LSRPPELTSALAQFQAYFGHQESDLHQQSFYELEKKVYGAHDSKLLRPDLGVEATLALLQDDMFLSNSLNGTPQSASEFQSLIEALVEQTVNVASPRFIGHMTSAMPYYVPSLMSLIARLNQNQVKLETSGGFSLLEKKVLSQVHQLIFMLDDAHYERYQSQTSHSYGQFCSGGTLGNLTALWAFRNTWSQDHGMDSLSKAKIYVSELGHYSIRKSINILGFMPDQLEVLEAQAFQGGHQLEQQIATDVENGHLPFLVIGVAGSTETGSVDNLDFLADIVTTAQCYFHVDAAWGGAFCMSAQARPLLKGIERADSVVIDAHKQLFVPIGCGLVLFRSAKMLKAIQFNANYILREGSFDLGQSSIEGSRPAMSVVLFAHLQRIGVYGFNLLLTSLLDLAKEFARLIEQSDDFELTSKPVLNILTYRWRPLQLQVLSQFCFCEKLNDLIILIQKKQRAQGLSFVSRTKLRLSSDGAQMSDVFRVVLANPLTKLEHCAQVLDEQRQLIQSDREIQAIILAKFN